MFADLIAPNPVFDPNAFWNQFFTFAATVVTGLLAYLSLRAGQKKLETKVESAGDAKIAEIHSLTDSQTAKLVKEVRTATMEVGKKTEQEKRAGT